MERRRSPRTIVDRAAKILVSDSDGLPCRIRDISEGGAKLRFESIGSLPNAFELQDAFTGIKRAVMMVWMGCGWLGVRFAHAANVQQKRRATFGRRQQ
jgi:hypothetical protein